MAMLGSLTNIKNLASTAHSARGIASGAGKLMRKHKLVTAASAGGLGMAAYGDPRRADRRWGNGRSVGRASGNSSGGIGQLMGRSVGGYTG